MRQLLSLLILLCAAGIWQGGVSASYSPMNEAGVLPCFTVSPYFGEQELVFTRTPGIKIHINAPSGAEFDKNKPTRLVLYALPNGNSTGQTIGRLTGAGDDWHYGIQHIGAQTRYVRKADRRNNVVTVYLEAEPMSWGKWMSESPERPAAAKETVEFLCSLFADYNPSIELNSHSGGGNFIFGYIDAVAEIPSTVKRISFIDSNYRWDDGRYGPKLAKWLAASAENKLFAACYDDANALLDGKPFVSREGGTWHRTQLMRRYLRKHVRGEKWIETETDSSICLMSENRRIKLYSRKNPERKIYHTVLVERNGFIESSLSGSEYDGDGYVFMGARVYDGYIQDSVPMPRGFGIPPRGSCSVTGSEFARMTAGMSAEERDSVALTEIISGNIPESMRRHVYLTDSLEDAAGTRHKVTICVLPDFIAIGSDSDFLRLPMLPLTAQKIADHYGAVLPNRKISDMIHRHSTVKLNPHPMTPDATMTTMPVFARHDSIVEAARLAAGAPIGRLIAGHKKDIVITNRIAGEPGRLFIYGWHYPDGKAIQPLSAAHTVDYVDYSHGVRLVCDEIAIDGRIHSLKEVLCDAVLYKLVSDECGPMEKVGY